MTDPLPSNCSLLAPVLSSKANKKIQACDGNDTGQVADALCNILASHKNVRSACFFTDRTFNDHTTNPSLGAAPLSIDDSSPPLKRKTTAEKCRDSCDPLTLMSLIQRFAHNLKDEVTRVIKKGFDSVDSARNSFKAMSDNFNLLRSSFQKINNFVPSSAHMEETSRYLESEVQDVLNEANESNLGSSFIQSLTTRLALKCAAYLAVMAIKDDECVLKDHPPSKRLKTTKDRSDSIETRSDQELEAGGALCSLKYENNEEQQQLPSSKSSLPSNGQSTVLGSFYTVSDDERRSRSPITNIIATPMKTDSLVQKLHKAISDAPGYATRTGRALPVSFRSTGGFEVHDLDTFRDLLVEHGLSKPGTKNYIESLQRRLSLYEFKKVIGKNVYKWNHALFKADGQDLHKIWSNNSVKHPPRLQNEKNSRSHDTDSLAVVVGLQGRIRSLEDRLKQVEMSLQIKI